jgi:hypothetical protein
MIFLKRGGGKSGGSFFQPRIGEKDPSNNMLFSPILAESAESRPGRRTYPLPSLLYHNVFLKTGFLHIFSELLL